MIQIKTITITEDILNDHSLSPFEMLLKAIQQQYPNATREQQANAMHINLHALYERNRRKKKEQEPTQICTTQICTPQMCTPQMCSEPQETEQKYRETITENRNTTSETKKKPTKETRERAYKKAMTFFKSLRNEDDMDKNRDTINTIYNRKDLFTQKQFDEFDEILSNILQ